MIELVEYLVSSLVPDGDYTVEMIEGANANDIIVTIAKRTSEKSSASRAELQKQSALSSNPQVQKAT